MGDKTARDKQARKRQFHRRLSIMVGVPLAIFIVYQLNARPGTGPVTSLYAVDENHALIVRSETDEATVLLVTGSDEEPLAATPPGAELRVISSTMHGLFLLLVDSQALEGMAASIENGHVLWSWAAPASDRLQLPAAATQAEVLGGVFLAFDGQVPKVFALSWSSGEVSWEASLVTGQTVEGIRLASDRLVVWTSGGWGHVIDPQTGSTVVLRDIAHSRCLVDGALLFLDPEGSLVRAPLSAPNQRDPLGQPVAAQLEGEFESPRLVSCGTRGDELVLAVEREGGASSALIGLDRRTHEHRWQLPLGPGSILGPPAQRRLVQRWPDRDPLSGELPRYPLLRLAGGSSEGTQGELILVDLDGHVVARRFGPLDDDLVVGRVGEEHLILGSHSLAMMRGNTGEPRVAMGFPSALPITAEQLTANGLWLTDGDAVGFCRIGEADTACEAGEIEVQTWPDDLDSLLRR